MKKSRFTEEQIARALKQHGTLAPHLAESRILREAHPTLRKFCFAVQNGHWPRSAGGGTELR
jgi:hypothetical protein